MRNEQDKMVDAARGQGTMIDFNLCGQICPATLLIALQEINRNQEKLRRGEVELVFKTDNRDATATIPEAATNMGYEVYVADNGPCYDIIITSRTRR